jgi:hypothetical protein
MTNKVIANQKTIANLNQSQNELIKQLLGEKIIKPVIIYWLHIQIFSNIFLISKSRAGKSGLVIFSSSIHGFNPI